MYEQQQQETSQRECLELRLLLLLTVLCLRCCCLQLTLAYCCHGWRGYLQSCYCSTAAAAGGVWRLAESDLNFGWMIQQQQVMWQQQQHRQSCQLLSHLPRHHLC
jgi:hypothetical protein